MVSDGGWGQGGIFAGAGLLLSAVVLLQMAS